MSLKDLIDLAGVAVPGLELGLTLRKNLLTQSYSVFLHLLGSCFFLVTATYESLENIKIYKVCQFSLCLFFYSRSNWTRSYNAGILVHDVSS